MTTIFHISDLHFAEKFSDINVASDNINKSKYFKGLEGHDIKIWLSFRKHILSRIKQSNNDFRICITGDLSRFGNINSFNLASDLFFDESESDISKEFGLRIAREKFHIIPGNHDSYDKSYFKRNNLRTFNGIFHPTIEEYPIIKEEKISNVDFLFFTIDSTYKKSAVSPAKKLGKGIVSKSQLDMIKGYLLKPQNNEAIKILCMHHSPIILDDKHDRNLMLERSQELLKSIVKNKIDIVLCGHLHDDFYDILPLKKLIKQLPKKRGWGKLGKKIFQETHLNDYHQIVIKGQKARYFDSLAYFYIKNGKDILDYTKDEFDSLNHFQNYIHNLPEYTEFLDDFNSFTGMETALIMAGSTCQENEKSNSYIELQIDDDLKSILVKRHKYNLITKQFDTKERIIKFNKSV
jgi:Predicted phosphohydrolases